MENSVKGSEKFVLNFFQQIDTILQEKKGGKLKKRKGKFTSRSYKKQKGGFIYKPNAKRKRLTTNLFLKTKTSGRSTRRSTRRSSRR